MQARRHLAIILCAGLCGCGDEPAASGGGTSTSGTSTPVDISTAEPTGPSATGDTDVATSTTTGDPSSATSSSSGLQSESSSTTASESSSSSGSTTGESTGDTTGLAQACDPAPANDPTPWSVSLGAPGEYLGVWSLDARAGAVVYTTMSAAVLDLGGGPLDPAGANHLFLASHAPSGVFQWAEHIGGPPQTTTIDSFHAAIDCEGNILLAGTFSGEISVQGTTLTAVPGLEFDDGMSFPTVDWFLFKFGPDGTLLWAQRFGDAASQRLSGLGIQGDGTIVVAGEFNGTMDLGGPPVTAGPWPDSVLAGFDTAGAFLWQRHFTGSQGVFFWRLDVGPNDRIHVLASASGDTDLGGGPIPYSGSQAILAHFAADGGHQWSQRWQHPAQIPFTLSADAAGGTVVSGYAPAFVLRYDAKGLFQWEHLYITDPNSTDRVAVEAVAAGHEIAVIGSLKGAFDFGGDLLSVLTPPTSMFVTRYDLAGNHLTSAIYDATIEQSVYRAAYGPDGELLLGGIFQGSFDLGPGPLISIGAADLFVHRFSP